MLVKELFGGKAIQLIISAVLALGVWIVFSVAAARLVDVIFGGLKNRASKIRGTSRHAKRSEENRIETMRGLVSDILWWVMVSAGVLMGARFVGVDILPLLTGLGIVGLAVSLAAQNILKDFINGIVLALEGQYTLGDFVKIGGHEGTVEKMTLRTTHITNMSGDHIIIPNSCIDRVVNSTRDWSQAKIVVGVSYESSPREVLDVMEEVARKMKEEFPDRITGDISCDGILEFLDSSMTMRTLMRTAPGEQWWAEREYRLRLKNAFDQSGIKIPFPQMVVRNAG